MVDQARWTCRTCIPFELTGSRGDRVRQRKRESAWSALGSVAHMFKFVNCNCALILLPNQTSHVRLAADKLTKVIVAERSGKGGDCGGRGSGRDILEEGGTGQGSSGI